MHRSDASRHSTDLHEFTDQQEKMEYTTNWYILSIMPWTVNLTRKAYKQLIKLPQSIQDLADLAVTDIEEQGINPQGWNTLKTGDDEYRLRLNYRYRMRYRVIDEQDLEIDVFYVGHRRDAYR